MKLLAPNGKPSNLTPEQYSLVRTPAFKAWFGDWEMAYKKAKLDFSNPAWDNVSKAVSYNGEPEILYHGSDKKFNVFDDLRIGIKTSLPIWETNYKPIIRGFYFTDNYNTAHSYTFNEETEKFYGKKYVREFFLNIKNPKIIDIKDKFGDPSYWDKSLDKKVIFAKNKGYDGVIIKNIIDYLTHRKTVDSEYFDYWGTNYVVFKQNQAKLADGSNTTFDVRNPDIRFDDGGSIPDLLSSQQVADKLGRELHWWKDDVVYVSGIKYKKVYLRPEYKRVTE
jgi:hypothetical protein